MHDALACGRRFHTFNVIDDFSCEALLIETDLNLPALRVVRVLNRIAAIRSCYAWIMLPEFISLALAEWVEKHAVKWGLSSRVSRRRTLILSALTEHTVQKIWSER